MAKSKMFLFFMLPALTLLILFSVLPIFVAFFISLTDMDFAGLANYEKIQFIGLDNYVKLFTDKRFFKVIMNTGYYVVFGVPLLLFVAVLVAAGINSLSTRVGEVFRTIYYLPAVTNIVAVSFVWMFLYNKTSGVFNYGLSFLGVDPIAWLNDPSYAKLSLIILAVWRGIGVNMIILLAAITAIPKSFYEAANIDGIKPYQQFLHITIPQLRYAIFFLAITNTIGWMQFFDEVYIMAPGEIANTKSIALYIYEKGFKLKEYGFASAASIAMFVMIMIVTKIQMKFKKDDD